MRELKETQEINSSIRTESSERIHRDAGDIARMLVGSDKEGCSTNAAHAQQLFCIGASSNAPGNATLQGVKDVNVCTWAC